MKAIKRLTALLITGAMMAMSGGLTASAETEKPNPNGWGGIDMSDAVYILQYLAGGFDLSDPTPLDYTQNGIVSQVDAQAIQYELVS